LLSFDVLYRRPGPCVAQADATSLVTVVA
jgi:hypothetical protein